MTTRVAYKDYVVHAHPFQLADHLGWSTDLDIERHDEKGVKVRMYSGSFTFRAKDDAIQHSLELGAQIIDSAYPGCTAP
jgi:hypothetical protein